MSIGRKEKKFDFSDMLNFRGWKDEERSVKDIEKSKDSMKSWNTEVHI